MWSAKNHQCTTLLLIQVSSLVSIQLHQVTAANTVSCLDNDGNSVPWCFMYKTSGGYEFAYADASTTTGTVQKFPRFMNDTENPIALTRTLQALVEDEESWFQYNDQPDVGTASSSYGHSKGVVALDSATGNGFWLTHSTPKFPASSGSTQFYFPKTEIKYGQTFLCLQLNSKEEFEKIGNHLQFIKPFLYFSTVTDSELEGYPNLLNVLNGNWNRTAGTTTNQITVGGTQFTTFSKNTAWNSALWGDLVAPTFTSSLNVQSWLRGYEEGPYCPPQYKYSVVDTKDLQMKDADGKIQSWTEGADHSKWAVSSNGGSLACIGDINRMTSQFKRGGGAVCAEGTVLHSQLSGVIVSTDSC